MATTIQVSSATKQMLDLLKKSGGVKTHDILIQQMLKKYARLPLTMFGSAKGMKWKKSDRADVDEL